MSVELAHNASIASTPIDWLNAKAKRMSLEDKSQSALNKTIATELEFISQK